MGKTERIGFQIFIDMSFNQDIAMRIVRFRQVTQCGRAWPEPMHFSSRNSAFSHDKVINLPCQRCLSSGGLTLIARRSGFIDPLLDLVEVASGRRRADCRFLRGTSRLISIEAKLHRNLATCRIACGSFRLVLPTLR